MSTDYSKRKGLSLLEILVSGLILTLVLAGLLNTFLAGRRWVMRNRLRMTGGELGKYILDPLQRYVRQDQWDPGPSQNCLAAGNCPNQQIGPGTGTAEDLDRVYTAQYTITPIGNIKKVKVVISYPEQ